MRLAQFNRLKLVAVSSAVVATLLGNGCKMQPKPMAKPPIAHPAGGPGAMPATGPSTEPTTNPATQAATEPVTPAVTPVPPVVVVPTPPVATTVPVTPPVSQPTTQPATPAATPPATEATSQPVAPPIQNAPQPVAQAEIDSDRTLAEQLAGVAEMEFNLKVTNKAEWPWIWKHQAALLAAAAELNPKEARFPRLEADALAQAHDTEGEKKALRLAIIANPLDEVSWNRRLDLYLAGIEDLGKKVEYLQQIINQASGDVVVPADVRAHAGYLLTRALLDRGEDDSAAAAVAEAIRVCPSSIECLQLQYRLLPATTPAYERCVHLLAILHANPMQYRVATEVADTIADNGLAREAEPFYQLAVGSAHQQGDPAQHAMLNWAAAMFIADPQARDAININEGLLKIDPNFTPAYFLQLVITRFSGDKDAYTKALTEAGNVIGNRVIVAINKVSPADPAKPTTRPVSDPSPLSIPDLAPTVAKLKESGSPELKAEFTQAVADLALLDGYFAQQPDAAAKLIDALPDVMGADSPQLIRLRGWNDLLAGKPEDARAKFLTVAGKDPLAELGLAKIMLTIPAEKPAAESMGRKLLQDHPAGLLGALLFEQLHSANVKLFPTSQATALRTLIANFPPELLDAAESPRNLYDIRIVPESVGSFIGDPLLAKVSIRNITNNDLTIGPDGYLKPELLFRMSPDTADKQSYDAFDTIAAQTVLPGHQSITQTVRVDQTPLLGYLNTQSDKNVTVSGTLATNRTIGGAGGFIVLFDKQFYRKSSALNLPNQQAATADLSNTRADQKISALNRLELFTAEMLHVAAGPPPATPPAVTPAQIAANLKEDIHRARGDALPAVAAWASKCEFDLTGAPAAQVNIINDLAQDPDWRHRQIALLLVNQVDPTVRDAVLKQLSIDPQESVRAEAVALTGRYALPPAPTTMPATAPAPAVAP